MFFISRCPVVVCVAADSSTDTGSELLVAFLTTHTRDNTPAVVRNVSTCRLQGSDGDTSKCDEGHIGDVNPTGGWRDRRGKADTGDKAADIAEVILTVNTTFT